MNLAFFVFIVGVSASNLNENGTNQKIKTHINHDQSFQVQKPEEKKSTVCPNNKVLLQTLNTLKDRLAQGDQILSPEKFRQILEGVIDNLNRSAYEKDGNDFKDIMEIINNRSKKEIARMPNEKMYWPSEKLTGKLSLEYDMPVPNHGDCQTLFNAIVTAINAAYNDLSVYCYQTGKCRLQNENIQNPTRILDWWPTYEIPYKNNINILPSNNPSKQTESYPYSTIMTLLQNYIPNTDNSIAIDKLLDNVYGNKNPNDITREQNHRLFELLKILNKPPAYIPQEPSHTNIGPGVKIDMSKFTPTLATYGEYQRPSILPKHEQNLKNISNFPYATNDSELRININVPNLNNNNILPKSNAFRYNVPTYENLNNLQQTQEKISLFPNNPKLPQFNSAYQLQYNQNPYYSTAQIHQAYNFPPYPTQRNSNQPGQQYDAYNTQIPQYGSSPGAGIQGQGIASGNQFSYTNMNTVPRLVPGIPNNTDQLQDLYRLTVTNGNKLNIAPNKHGVVELTFTLHQPHALEYKPVYYVKYTLPYDTYVYNIRTLLQDKPYMRSDPHMYQELLSMANITESSQDLKNLDKKEIMELVATSGALVNAKLLEGSKDTEKVAGEVDGILRMANELGTEAILNATQTTLDNTEEVLQRNESAEARADIEEAFNTTNSDVASILNTRSMNNPVLNMNSQYYSRPAVPLMQTNAYNSYVRPNIGYNNYKIANVLNRPMSYQYSRPLSQVNYQVPGYQIRK